MPCPECGEMTVDGTEGCDALFKDVIAREFGQPELFGVHRLTVDAYSLQHPVRYMKSTKSAAAHLTGMCWSIEYGGGASVSQALSRWLDGPIELARVTPPAGGERGSLTIRHVHTACGSPQHAPRVRAWAECVWAAWSVGHAQARAWVEAVAGDRAERGGPRT